ncbi:MAG: hypothetical protein QJR09_13320 [Micrococcus sp.]|nr:hypothetical protein [Micrococcus sp.]
MYPPKDARELAVLMRISHELDVVGDVTATVDSPSELIAWVLILDQPQIVAWRAEETGHRYINATAQRDRAPIRGAITAVLSCEEHPDFWNALGLVDLAEGERRNVEPKALSKAWDIMPITPDGIAPTPPAGDQS